MIQFKIMNVLLSDTEQFLGCPLLLVRADRPWRRSDSDGAWLLDGQGTFDFNTYFNAISAKKWYEYTVAKDFFLHLEVRGSAARIIETAAGAFTWYSEEVAEVQLAFDASDDWQTIDLPLVVREMDACVSFKLVTDGPVEVRNGYFYTEIDESQLRNVELALCTTTFKKEAYIERNIGIVKEQVIGSGDLISKHFHMHVVDNGRTLDAASLEGEGVTIHPNPNAGGAGGFARGMIEAMEQEPRATHVLLMDDDVLVSSESIIRTFNLLSLVNDDYADAFVSGAMMNLDEPNIRWEDMGFVGFDGAFHPLKPVSRMDVLHDMVANETFDIPDYLPKCEDQSQHYAAWWYCVIPMTQIDRNGLPLPIFVRGDDAEYSLRCKPSFMTMNGICVWHVSFHMRYSAAQERYQMVRNTLIDRFTTGFAPMADFVGSFEDMVTKELQKFNYDNAELAIKGFEDFLRGPEWIMQPVAEQAFMDANRSAEKLIPFDELFAQARELGVDLTQETDWKIYRDRPLERGDQRLVNLTFNGQRFPDSYVEKDKVAVIDNVGWAYPVGKFQHAEYIISIDLQNQRGIIRHIDRERFRQVKDHFRQVMRDYNDRKDELEQAYSDAREEMTSVSFWKKYLGIA